MNRQLVWTGAIPQDTDLLLTNKNVMLALGNALQMILGTSTQIDGLACTPTAPAGMTVNVAAGSIISLEEVDSSSYGSIAPDTADSVMKQGIILTQSNFSCPAPVTTGYSVVYLVQAQFQEVDGGAEVLSYYNDVTPSEPLNGPGGTGDSNFTVRQGLCAIGVVTGVPATTGSQTTPAATAGWTPLYTVTVANGQSTITSGNIVPVSGAPFILEKLAAKVSIPTGDARWLKLTSQNFWYGADTGAANAYVAALTNAPAAYFAGMTVTVLIGNTNTGASQVNFAGLGLKNIMTLNSAGALVAVAAGQLPAGALVDMQYDGTQFQLTGGHVPISVSASNTSYGTTTGGPGTFAITTTPTFVSMVTSQIIEATFNVANTGAVTVNPNALGAITVTDREGNALAAGAIAANTTYELVYDGTNLRLMRDVESAVYGTTTNSGNNYAVYTNPPFSVLLEGQPMFLTFNAGNTGAATLNPNGIGPTTLTDAYGGALTSGSIHGNKTYLTVFDGTNIRLMGDVPATSYGTTAGGTTAYTVATTPSFGAIFTAQHISFTMNATNTGAVTLNPNGTGALAVTDAYGNALTAGALQNGKTYDAVYDGSVLRVLTQLGAGAIMRIKRQILFSTGTYTPTAGLINGDAELQAPGGGSGGLACTAGGSSGSSGGGGGGEYTKKMFTAADIGAGVTVTLGAPGAAGTASGTTGTNGGDGGNCTFGALLSANGGKGGKGGNPGSANGNFAGGVGGSGSTGDYHSPGGNGKSGSSNQGGDGGSSFMGPATFQSSAATNVDGTAGIGYGSGACGATSGGIALQQGAVGGSPLCIVTEYLSK